MSPVLLNTGIDKIKDEFKSDKNEMYTYIILIFRCNWVLSHVNIWADVQVFAKSL